MKYLIAIGLLVLPGLASAAPTELRFNCPGTSKNNGKAYGVTIVSRALAGDRLEVGKSVYKSCTRTPGTNNEVKISCLGKDSYEEIELKLWLNEDGTPKSGYLDLTLYSGGDTVSLDCIN